MLRAGGGKDTGHNGDRIFTVFMFLIVILVSVVVIASQYQQFEFGRVSVQQNSEILDTSRDMARESIRTHQAVNTTIEKLLVFEKQFKANSLDTLVNISKSHDVLIRYVQSLDLSSADRIKVLQVLIDTQTIDILKKLGHHENTTDKAFNNSAVNRALLVENNAMLKELLNKTQ